MGFDGVHRASVGLQVPGVGTTTVVGEGEIWGRYFYDHQTRTFRIYNLI